MRRWIAALAGALVLGSLVVPPAAAHDSLIASDPPDGAVLEVTPSEIVLEFTGNILDINPALQVTDQDGTEHAVGDAQIAGTFVTWEFAEPLPAGTFDVIWVVTSSDGHPIDGELAFTVERTPEPEATEEEPEATEPSPEDTEPAETEPTTEPAPETSEPVAEEPDDTATQDATEDDPADISDNAEAWLIAGGIVTVLVAVLAIVLIRRNRDPNGPPGQH